MRGAGRVAAVGVSTLAVIFAVSCGNGTMDGQSGASSSIASESPVSSTETIALTEIDAGPYTGQAFGTHFTDATGRIACNFNPMQGGCVFSAPEHRAADPIPVCLGSDTPMTYTAVGWRSSEAPAAVAPGGRFTDVTMPLNSKMSITLGWPDTSNKVTCSSTAAEFRCTQAKSGHGFVATSTAIDVF